MSGSTFGMPAIGASGLGNTGGALPPELIQRLMQMQQQQAGGAPGGMGGPAPVRGQPMNAVGPGMQPQQSAGAASQPQNFMQALGGPQGLAALMQMYKNSQGGGAPQGQQSLQQAAQQGLLSAQGQPMTGGMFDLQNQGIY